MSTLTIIRGLPGTGKTTIAESLNCIHLEADMYFMKDGKYCFDGNKIKNAHDWCYKAFKNAVECGMDVVVSNTFTTRKEFIRYIEFAQIFEYDINVISTIRRRIFGSIHNVPDDVLSKMKNRWEKYERELEIP